LVGLSPCAIMNESKNDKVGARQVDLASKFSKAGLLSDEGLKAVESAARKPSSIIDTGEARSGVYTRTIIL